MFLSHFCHLKYNFGRQLMVTSVFHRLVFFLLLFSFNASGQFFSDIKEVSQYQEQLVSVDKLLKLNPNECVFPIQNLLNEAKKKNNGELEAIAYILKGTYFYYIARTDSSKVYFEKAIVSAEKVSNSRLRTTASIRRLFVIDSRADKKIMISLMNEEYQLSKKNNDSLNMIYSLIGLANYSSDIDSNENSIKFYLEAMDIAKENDYLFEYGVLLNNLGLLKLRLKSPDDAYKDFQEALKISEELNSLRLQLILQENIGNYFVGIDSLDDAIEQYQSTFNIAQEKNFPALALNSLINLGSVERIKGNYKNSDSLISRSLEMAFSRDLYQSISYIFLTKAYVNLERKQYQKLNANLDSAVVYSKYSIKSKVLETVYELKYKMYQQKNNPKKALEYYIKKSDLSDSLNRNSHVQMMSELQLKYDVDKKELQRLEEQRAYEKEISQKEQEANSTKQNLGIALILFILTGAAFTIYYFREKNKRETKFSSALVDKLEEERARIARELHDGVGQSLIIIKNKFNNLDILKSEESQQLDANFTETIEEVRSISRTLIPPELRRLGLRKSIEKMMSEIELSTELIVTSDLDFIDTLSISEAQELRLYRIIQELTTNTIKHSKASSLKVEFIKNTSGFLIVYQDNGIGINPDDINNRVDSVGLRSINQRLKFLKGKIKYAKQEKGLKVILNFKHL